MPVSRMRMRPWLENRIESQSITGLKWIDRDKKTFSIPWKHAARHGWEMDKDACLFKQWAIHTGKYREGEGSPDPKTWKANFRCAMNSLPDIEEVKNQSINKGHGAVRVYRMLPAVTKKRDKKSSAKDGKHKSRVCKGKVETSHQDTEDSRTSGEDNSMQENTVDSTQNHSDSDFALSPSGNEEAVSVDWPSPLLISPDSTNNPYPYPFQVSPLRSDIEDDEATIIALAQQIEDDQRQWQPYSEVGEAETLSSPGSQYSDTSSEEIELRFYTELTARNMDPMDLVTFLDPWDTSNTLPISCAF